ncbi:MAG: DUF4160 domain-containing protein [Chloroflexi bacterium]|nr:DUF4160 domain-containing protein [Chloroflexota bacterium]
MPTISRFYGILIQMFYDEKHSPHFHALYAEYKASIEIKTGKIVVGKLPRNAQRLVLAWAKIHRDELLNNWERARREEPLKDIAPLE